DSSRLRSLWSLVNLLNSLQFLLLALNCSSKWGLGLVKGVEILGHASEVGTSQIIAHAGSGRSGIDVRGAAARLDIVMFTVRKSILNRVRPEEFGTLECICAAENRSTPPGGA